MMAVVIWTVLGAFVVGSLLYLSGFVYAALKDWREEQRYQQRIQRKRQGRATVDDLMSR